MSSATVYTPLVSVNILPSSFKTSSPFPESTVISAVPIPLSSPANDISILVSDVICFIYQSVVLKPIYIVWAARLNF